MDAPVLDGICARCSEPFPLTRKGRRYCSDHCRYNAWLNANRPSRRKRNTVIPPDQKQAHNRKHRYGITPEEYERIRKRQNDSCAICHREDWQFSRGLFVDHDHATNTVRGLLCPQCNAFLGVIEDNPEALKRAEIYLRAKP
jgi:hypothetical protein